MIKNRLAAAAVAALAALPAVASAQDAPRAYGTLGYTRLDTEQADLGAVTARLGYKFHQNFGLEGEAGIGVEDEDIEVSINGSGVIELKHDVAAYAVAFLPLGDRFEAFARIGYGTSKIEASVPGVTVRDEGESFNYGVGASAFLTAHDGLRADWTRRDFQDGGEADTWSLSYIRRF